MSRYILYFDEIQKNSIEVVGGKGANLGELIKAGFEVPEGFCINTEAFSHFLKSSSRMREFYKIMEELEVNNLKRISAVANELRKHIISLQMPEEVKNEIELAIKSLGEHSAYAVRSSATAEDLPEASFAGQQESYLNIAGIENLLRHIKLCWASLFTDRAIAYRIKNNISHKNVLISVIIQKMVPSEVSGIMFTAEPISGNRRIVSINASFGLGEALVQGIVSPDLYKVDNRKVISKIIGEKALGIYSSSKSGIEVKKLPIDQGKQEALKDEEVIQLASIGKAIEKHYGSPQDIEWALCRGRFYILQSRPITSLYPIPETLKDKDFHVFISFGHQQMMTNAIKPMGISVLRTYIPFGKGKKGGESGLMYDAGNRLYMDVTFMMKMPILGKRIPDIAKGMDELIGSALEEVMKREEFKKSSAFNLAAQFSFGKALLGNSKRIIRDIVFTDLSKVHYRVNGFIKEEIEYRQREVDKLQGVEAIIYIQKMINEVSVKILKEIIPYISVGGAVNGIIRNLCGKWLGDENLAVSLNKSLEGNVTSEMGMAIGDLADIARQNRDLLSYLQNSNNGTSKVLMEGLLEVRGSEKFCTEFQQFMMKYGMRCPGEIDISNPRWYENPTELINSILNHIRSCKGGQHRENFRQGLEEAERTRKNIIRRLKFTPSGERKAYIMNRLIDVYRTTAALREHEKYMNIQLYWIAKKSLLKEAVQLKKKKKIENAEDIFYLSLKEVAEVIGETYKDDVKATIRERRKDFERFSKLIPPRVVTSDGEVLTGNYIRNGIDMPKGALIGSPVSTGTVEGRARIILDPSKGKLFPGDVLIAPFTDPGWTPLFISAKGVVMEVGGMMTHGAVVAREYGIPAVAGVINATELIKDGDLIRVNGDKGYIEVLK